MATKFGRIEYSDTTFVEQTFHKNQVVTSASAGTHQHFMKRDDYSDAQTGGLGATCTPWLTHKLHAMLGASLSTVDCRGASSSAEDCHSCSSSVSGEILNVLRYHGPSSLRCRCVTSKNVDST